MNNRKVTYTYNIFYDIEWMIHTVRNKKWLQEKNLVFFMPSFSRMIRLWFHRPQGPYIETTHKITCYFISSGTWGSYRPPNKIFICPHHIPDLKKVIQHEITHLEHEKDVSLLTHEDKERYINTKEKEYFGEK
jgi:hypothetical protein